MPFPLASMDPARPVTFSTLMRILTIADVPPDPNAGVSGTEWHTNAALRSLGHHVDALWHTDLGRRIRHGNIRYLLELPRAIEDKVRRAGNDYDVVQVSQPHGYRAASIARERGAIFIHRSHGVEPRIAEELRRWCPDQRSLLRRAGSAMLSPALDRHMRRTAKMANGHIVYCTQDADFLNSRLGVARERIAVIAPAPPFEFADSPPEPMTAARLRRALYVSQFAPFKAPEVAAAVMRSLADTHELTWVCDRRHHDAVRRLIGLRVELHDWMPASELRSVYDSHGVFLFPSYVEGYGKVFLEAMSRGLCVVASDTSGAHDAITHGKDGVLVPVGDASAMADAVKALSLDRAQRMSAEAVSTARSYTWGRAARQTAAFFHRLRDMR